MIILRYKFFSNNEMLSEIINTLEEDGVQDFEVSRKLSNDNISITSDLKALTIYIPEECEYDVYSIEGFLMSLNKLFRTTTKLDRNIYVMTVSRPLTKTQYVKLIKEIIELNDFCTIIDKDYEED